MKYFWNNKVLGMKRIRQNWWQVRWRWNLVDKRISTKTEILKEKICFKIIIVNSLCLIVFIKHKLLVNLSQ